MEIRRLQLLARTAGVDFSFPLLLFGAAGLVSGSLLAAVLVADMSIWIYNGWWFTVAVAAPVLVARHYQYRLAARGVGISRNRAGRYTAATEVVAAVLWFAHPLYPLQISAPWLAFAAGAAVVGWVWRNWTLPVLAGCVVALVVVGAVSRWPMAVTDLAVGALSCATAIHRPGRHGPLGTMLPPA